MKDKITVFVDRLKKIGIEVELGGNYPWIYLHKVNGNTVLEKQWSDHFWTLAMVPIRMGQEIKFKDLKETFKIIRKYENIRSRNNINEDVQV